MPPSSRNVEEFSGLKGEVIAVLEGLAKSGEGLEIRVVGVAAAKPGAELEAVAQVGVEGEGVEVEGLAGREEDDLFEAVELDEGAVHWVVVEAFNVSAGADPEIEAAGGLEAKLAEFGCDRLNGWGLGQRSVLKRTFGQVDVLGLSNAVADQGGIVVKRFADRLYSAANRCPFAFILLIAFAPITAE